MQTIKHDVLELYDQMTDQRIISGHTYHGALVWLSAENQLNYKAAYDLAVQFQGEHGTLPVTFKLGTTDQPIYHRFETIEQLTDFYLGVVAHKTACLTDGWALKDAIDWTKYHLWKSFNLNRLEGLS